MAVGAFVPVVPVAGHQVVVDAGLRLVHVLVYVRRFALRRLYGLYPPDVLFIGADTESFDIGDTFAAAAARNLGRVAASGVHPPHLHRAAAIRQEIDFPPVGTPLGIGVVRRRVGKARHGARCHILHPDGRHAAVLGHVVVGLRIEERLAVGRERRGACTAHFPHHLGGEPACGDFVGRQGVVDRKRLRAPVVACAQSHSCNSHKKE